MAFLGCSRGLGRAVALSSPKGERLFSARSKQDLVTLSKEVKGEVAQLDFSKPSAQWLPTVEAFRPTHIYYFSGGGPFGPYVTKKFQDHEWTFNVNFKSPAQLIHWSLQKNLQQFVAVGSAVAESSGDAKAASYAAAKHALLGLCRSVWLESEMDIRLFSPGYMDTKLLPPRAMIRRVGTKLHCPEKLAELFWNWVTCKGDKKHYTVK